MPIVIIILVIIGLIYFKLEHKGKIIKTVILIATIVGHTIKLNETEITKNLSNN